MSRDTKTDVFMIFSATLHFGKIPKIPNSKFTGRWQAKKNKWMGKSLWLWWKSTRSTKINGVLTSTTVTLLVQLKITVSVQLDNLPKTYHLLISCKKEFGVANGAHLLWHLNLWPSGERREGDLKDTLIYSPKLSSLWQVTLIAQLGLIGGTMGLFTGFSILSGIEIVYFASKFLFRRKLKCCKNRAESDVWCDII